MQNCHRGSRHIGPFDLEVTNLVDIF
jgi:hypothetical protein